MTFLPWILMALAFQEEPLETLLEGLHSDDPEVRTKASAGILAGWKRWDKEDLAKLEEASMDRDLEASVRATDAMSLILIRRKLGEPLLEKIPGADQAFHTGGDAAKLEVLTKARALWRRQELTDTTGLEALAARSRWNDPELLARFAQKKGQALSIPVDPATRARLRVKEVELLGVEGRKRAGKVAEYLGDEAPEVRAAAVRAIGGLGAKEQAPRIAALLKDGSSAVRGEALFLLGSWGSKEYASDFAGLLQDPNGAVRRGALEALAGWGQRDVAPQIAKLLEDPYAQSRAEAAAALGALGAREFAPGVARLLQDPHASVRRSAAIAIGRFGAREFTVRLEKLLGDPDPDLRLSAARSIGELGIPSQALLGLLGDDDPEVRLEAAWVLGHVASKEMTRRIAERLDDREPDVRQGAVRALGRLRAREVREPVARLCADSSSWVRSEAVGWLGELGGPEDAATIRARLKDGDRKVRLQAALASGERGPEADAVLGLAAAVGRMRRGGSAEASVLRAIGADDVAFAVLGSAVLEALSRVHGKDAWERLERPFSAGRAIESWKDLGEALQGLGLTLEVEGAYAIGRLDDGVGRSGHDGLGWLLGRLDAPAIVLDGRKVRLMDRRAALAFWQKRLDGR